MTVNDPIRIPEVYEPDSSLPTDLVALRRFAWMLDAAVAIPGTRKRVGVSAAVGLIPGVGDAVGAFLSAWIILGAIRHRVPGGKIAKMVLNVVIDVMIGSIPVVGDIADILFKENLSNIDILVRSRKRGLPPRSATQMAFAAIMVLGATAFLALIAIVFAVLLLAWLIRSLM
ncbi:MAG TPA: DUF4112 domain-containing protein [Thermoanaerobaculia bacterium]|nr:DUF4112 domain-containing protein [Thermoanaerobaculia bacterium]